MNTDHYSTNHEISRITASYEQWMLNHIELGYSPYLIRFMFRYLSSNKAAACRIMEREIETFYGRLVTRAVRKPTKPQNAAKLPRLIGCPDFPVPKGIKARVRDHLINDGLHQQAIILIPPISRLDTRLDLHLMANRKVYIQPDQRLEDIHATPIKHNMKYVTSYVLKSLPRRRALIGDILILPRSLSEL